MNFRQKIPSLASISTRSGSYPKPLNLDIEYVPREQNSRANLLLKLASTKALGNNRSVIQETLNSPTVNLEVRVVEANLSFWGIPIIQFLKEGVLPDDLEEVKKLRRTVSLYTIIGDHLYKRSFTMPLLKCVDGRQVAYVMTEAHERVCESHIGGWSLVAKILRARYYWPTVHNECLEYVKDSRSAKSM